MQKTPIEKLARLVLPLFCAAALLVYADVSLAAAKDALTLCLTRVVPALFPYYVVTSMLLQSGIADAPALSRRDGKRLPRALVCFLFGSFAGYPSGARFAARFGGEDLAAFCNLCSPVFLYGVVAVSLCGEPRLFAPLAIAHYGSALLLTLLGSAVRAGEPFPPSAPRNGSAEPPQAVLPLPQLIGEGMFAMLKISGCIVFFSVVSGILSRLLFGSAEGLPAALLSGLLELTGGCAKVASLRLPSAASAALLAFLVSLGGVSVLMQTLVTTSGLRAARYAALKLSHAFLAGGAAYCLAPLFLSDAVQTAFAPVAEIKQNAVVLFAYVFVSLAGMCAMYLFALILKRAGDRLPGPR